jgi:hypothetical protein
MAIGKVPGIRDSSPSHRPKAQHGNFDRNACYFLMFSSGLSFYQMFEHQGFGFSIPSKKLHVVFSRCPTQLKPLLKDSLTDFYGSDRNQPFQHSNNPRELIAKYYNLPTQSPPELGDLGGEPSLPPPLYLLIRLTASLKFILEILRPLITRELRQLIELLYPRIISPINLPSREPRRLLRLHLRRL